MAPFGDEPPTLTARDRKALRSISVPQRLPAGTRLFEQGRAATYVFNVLQGCVYSERLLPTGARRGMALILPGDLCGLASHGVYVNSGRTLTATEVLRIHLGELKAMLLGNAALQLFLLCKVAHALRESQRQILLLSRKDPIERVALVLSTLRNAAPRRRSDTFVVPAKLPELASYLDLTVRQLTRAVDRLIADRTIRYDRGRVTIADPAALQRLVDREPRNAPIDYITPSKRTTARVGRTTSKQRGTRRRPAKRR
jgi:CRP/FNR family transcriptional regulator